MSVQLDELVTSSNFNEQAYLSHNHDVSKAVQDGDFENGADHFRKHGFGEGRRQRYASPITEKRADKLRRMNGILDLGLPHVFRDDTPDFLSEELRELSGISDTNAVSSNNYDENVRSLIDKYPDGLILDCGAGRRNVYYDNVVNFEIVNYDTTDIIGVGERLPFKDNSFDAVVSIAVLEHVKDPFLCAREIIRVLKPGGELYCCVPFLQPLHGYPHHYYNMSHQGLKSLFDHSMTIEKQDVLASTMPIWSLTWFLQRWHAQLPTPQQQAFEKLTVRDFLQSPADLVNLEWCSALPKEAQFELASATVIWATKD